MGKLKWSLNMCIEEGLKYNSRSDFKKYSAGCYVATVRNGWLEIVCKNMTTRRKPNNYWNKDACLLEALKCNSRSEFAKLNGWGYQFALKNGFLDEICLHMIPVGNIKKRCVYSYEFENNIVYVGLTHDIDKRWTKRLLDNKDVVNIYIKKTNKLPIIKKLTEYIDSNDASKLEGVYLNNYISNGWTPLNRIKTGSLGGDIIKWTYEICRDESLKYTSLAEFRNKNNNCLSRIYKNGWKELLTHLLCDKLPNDYWDSYERCLDAAKKCKTKTEFCNKHRGAYNSSVKNLWLDDIYNKCNIKTLKSPLYYEISDELFNKIHNDRLSNKKTLEFVCKEYGVGIEKLKSKYKELNIRIIRIDRMG